MRAPIGPARSAGRRAPATFDRGTFDKTAVFAGALFKGEARFHGVHIGGQAWDLSFTAVAVGYTIEV